MSLSRLLALALAMVFLPATGAAAADMYLKIGGVKGESKIVPCPAGVCVVDGLAPGQYTVEVCDAKGAVIPSEVELECTVNATRAAGSGQASGKRQHKPIRIVKEASASATNQLTITEAGTQVTLRVVSGGAPARAQDYNSSRSNKTSN